jgi:hypothetical protein
VLPPRTGGDGMPDPGRQPGLVPLLRGLEDGLKERLDLPLSRAFGDGAAAGEDSGPGRV